MYTQEFTMLYCFKLNVPQMKNRRGTYTIMVHYDGTNYQ